MGHRDVGDNVRSIHRPPPANFNPYRKKGLYRIAVSKPAGFERNRHGGPIFDLIQRCVARSISALLFRYRRGSPIWMPPRYYISWNGYYCHTHGLKTREMRARVRVMIGRAKSDEFISAREAWYLCYYDPGILMEILLVADLIRLVLLSWSRCKFYDRRNLWIPCHIGENSAIHRSFGFHAYHNLNCTVLGLTFRSIADLRHKNHRKYEEAAKHSRRRRMAAYTHFPRCKRRNG